ncbi:MAG: PaaI family thioesterase [Microscillaceae bacterium]|nr:PaaI family thioesterase [Microscillaceae bacterium]MDW8459616.1 PaaI family thioesterase [Cytophagales bacterium]
MINPEISLEMLNSEANNPPISRYLGIEFTEIGPDYVCAKMPVDKRNHQPMGILHGGVSVVLAETLGSVGAWLCIDTKKYYCVGLEINANHIRSVRSGYVYGKATLLHAGRMTQVWEVKITNEEQKLVCVSRITMAVVPISEMR